MSCFCNGVCETNRECITFYRVRRVRYDLGMKWCKKCEKSWQTDDIRCHCCSNLLRGSRRQKRRSVTKGVALC